MPLSEAQNVQLLIYDVNGKVITELPINSKQKVLELDASNWNKGVYIASLMIENYKIESTKFIVID